MQRVMMGLAKVMALLGGVVLTLLILLMVVSVLGRTFNGILHLDWLEAMAPGFSQRLLDWGVGPVLGDFELVEAGIAFAIFAFLPLATLTGSHATVDILTMHFSPSVNRSLVALWEVVFAIVMIVVAWRLFWGMENKMRYGETTFLLQFPVWWAYAASLAAAALSAAVTVYTAVLRVMEVVTGRTLIHAEGGAGH